MNKNHTKFIRRIIRILEMEFEFQSFSQISCCGVTLSQCHVIMELFEKDKTSIKELSEIFGLDKSTLSRTIDGMVESGYVDRIINNEDRRFMILRLTQKGIEKANYISSICDKYYEELFKYIPNEKHSMIMDSLTLLSGAMNKMRKEGNFNLNGCCN